MLVSSLSGAGSRGCVPDGEGFPCLTILFMDPPGPDPLIRSSEWHLSAENHSAPTVTTYLIGGGEEARW